MPAWGKSSKPSRTFEAAWALLNFQAREQSARLEDVMSCEVEGIAQAALPITLACCAGNEPVQTKGSAGPGRSLNGVLGWKMEPGDGVVGDL